MADDSGAGLGLFLLGGLAGVLLGLVVLGLSEAPVAETKALKSGDSVDEPKSSKQPEPELYF